MPQRKSTKEKDETKAVSRASVKEPESAPTRKESREKESKGSRKSARKPSKEMSLFAESVIEDDPFADDNASPAVVIEKKKKKKSESPKKEPKKRAVAVVPVADEEDDSEDPFAELENPYAEVEAEEKVQKDAEREARKVERISERKSKRKSAQEEVAPMSLFAQSSEMISSLFVSTDVFPSLSKQSKSREVIETESEESSWSSSPSSISTISISTSLSSSFSSLSASLKPKISDSSPPLAEVEHAFAPEKLAESLEELLPVEPEGLSHSELLVFLKSLCETLAARDLIPEIFWPDLEDEWQRQYDRLDALASTECPGRNNFRCLLAEVICGWVEHRLVSPAFRHKCEAVFYKIEEAETMLRDMLSDSYITWGKRESHSLEMLKALKKRAIALDSAVLARMASAVQEQMKEAARLKKSFLEKQSLIQSRAK